MPRRFSRDARNVVLAATNAAALLGADQTEAEHFLIALLVGPTCRAQDYLRRHALTRTDVEQAIADGGQAEITFDDEDVAALDALGFDLPQILHELEDRFGPVPHRRRPSRGPRRLRATIGDTAKQLLQQALFEASLQKAEISPEHLLLGLLREPTGICRDLVTAYSLSYEDARDFFVSPPQSNAG